MEPFKLPLKLKVNAITRSKSSTEARCTVTDAAGTSVEFVPIEVGPQRSAAELAAILQSHVSGMASALLKREAATLGKDLLPAEDVEASFKGLVGQEFTGSVTT
jgi:hypothetical protein